MASNISQSLQDVPGLILKLKQKCGIQEDGSFQMAPI
jgi:hypothetical protein